MIVEVEAECVGGKTTTYQCDGCGTKAESKPIPPPPALGLYDLPELDGRYSTVLKPEPSVLALDDLLHFTPSHPHTGHMIG